MAKQVQLKAILLLIHLQEEPLPVFGHSGIFFGPVLAQTVAKAAPTCRTTFLLEQLLRKSSPLQEHTLIGASFEPTLASLGKDSGPVDIRLVVVLVVEDQILVIIHIVVDALCVPGLLDAWLLHPELLELDQSLGEPSPVLNSIQRPVVHRLVPWLDKLVVHIFTTAVGGHEVLLHASGVGAVAVVANVLELVRGLEMKRRTMRVVHHHDGLIHWHDGVRQGRELLVVLDPRNRCFIHCSTTLHPFVQAWQNIYIRLPILLLPHRSIGKCLLVPDLPSPLLLHGQLVAQNQWRLRDLDRRGPRVPERGPLRHLLTHSQLLGQLLIERLIVQVIDHLDFTLRQLAIWQCALVDQDLLENRLGRLLRSLHRWGLVSTDDVGLCSIDVVRARYLQVRQRVVA